MHQFHLPDMSCGHRAATVATTVATTVTTTRRELDPQAARVLRVQTALARREPVAATLAEGD